MNDHSLPIEEVRAIEAAGYRVVSAEPGQPVVVEEIRPSVPERPGITGADLVAAMGEMNIGLNHIVRPVSKKRARVQPWREKQEAARLAKLKARQL